MRDEVGATESARHSSQWKGLLDIFFAPLQSIKHSFRNLLMKRLTRDRVVPTISASVYWLISAMTSSSLPAFPQRASNSPAGGFSPELKSRL